MAITNVTLQPHQQQIQQNAQQGPLRQLLVHSLGSGKSLSGIVAAETAGLPYTAVAPASLRTNYQGQIAKFTDQQTPSSVMSYTALAQGKPVLNDGTVIFDEAHNLRNPDSARTQQAIQLADKAKQVVMLSGSPVVNRPGDLAVPLRMLTGVSLSPDEFESRYVKSKPVYPSLLRKVLRWPAGTEPAINNEKELKNLFKGHVDYYDAGKPVVPTQYEDVHVTMSPEQHRLYQAMFDSLPWWAKKKLQGQTDLSSGELQRLTSFLTGPRQVSLSDLPYAKNGDPYQSFLRSPKLTAAHQRLSQVLEDPRAKALVFSNFIDAGLHPYAAGLGKANIPHAVFSGKLNDAGRQQLVDDYNTGKIRVALLGPSGTEGLSFKGTQLVQLLDPHFGPVRPRQSVGRALRFDSHDNLPEDLKNVKVQRFYSRAPLSYTSGALSALGVDQEHKTYATDDYIRHISDRKDKTNQKFMDLLRDVGTVKRSESLDEMLREVDRVAAVDPEISDLCCDLIQHNSTKEAKERVRLKDVVQLARLGDLIPGVFNDFAKYGAAAGQYIVPDANSLSSRLARIKQMSDLGTPEGYAVKTHMLRSEIARAPTEWFVDSQLNPAFVGVTHKPTGWRYHVRYNEVRDLLPTAPPVSA